MKKEMTFGEIITRVRADHFGSQGKLAKFLGFHRSSISYWELGAVNPSRANIVKVKTKLLSFLTGEEFLALEKMTKPTTAKQEDK